MNISLSGKAGAGKDAIAKVFTGMGYRKLSFAGPLKEAVAHVLGVTLSDVEAIKDGRDGPEAAKRMRRLLQVIGTEGFRDSWSHDVHTARMDIALKSMEGPIVITDTRFPDEVELLKERGFRMVYLTCPEEYQRDAGNHRTEALGPGDGFDLVINNDRSRTPEEIAEEIISG